MKKARLYKKLGHKQVQCQACSWYCRIAPGKTGLCGVRQNKNGVLYLLVYGKAIGMHEDPMEKKPLFHFLPGKTVLSFGTFGCNFGCLFCQNWHQSQTAKELKQKTSDLIDQFSQDFSPQEIVDLAIKRNIPAIAYTYNEPAVFFEYAYDTMKLAKKAGLKNIFVSNGYESEENFNQLKSYLDAINIDLKSFREEFYQKICQARLKPVLENIKKFYQAGIWLEITTLLINGHNDSDQELTQIAHFIADLNPDIPWHITACHPDYQMLDIKPTSKSSLLKAWRIGKKAGLNYVYLGNILDEKHATTFCPQCQKDLIIRSWSHSTITNFNPDTGKCQLCQTPIPGVWQ